MSAQLSAVGIQPTAISFNTLTMESDRFICAREDGPTKKEVVIVDLADANNVIRRPIGAESAIMHPTEKIIALRGELRVHEERAGHSKVAVGHSEMGSQDAH